MSSAAPTHEVIPQEIDQHRIAWLTTDGNGWTTLTKLRFATDGGKIYASLRLGSVALRQIETHPQVRLCFGRGNLRVSGSGDCRAGFRFTHGRNFLGASFVREEILDAQESLLLEPPWCSDRDHLDVAIEGATIEKIDAVNWRIHTRAAAHCCYPLTLLPSTVRT